jgi:ABC-type multidrug transport system permease subunit
VIFGLGLISGLYFPFNLLPVWIRWMAQAQPFTPAVELLRWSLSGRPLSDPVWLDVGKLGGFVVVMVPVALAALVFVLRKSRSRGTILEF